MKTRKVQINRTRDGVVGYSNEFVAVDLETDGGGTFGELREIHSVALWNDDVQLFRVLKWKPDDGLLDEHKREWNEMLGGRTPIFHNAAFDVAVLRELGIECNVYEDSLIIGYNLNPNRKVIKVVGEEPSRHGIVAWGARFGMPKLSHPDWDVWRQSPDFYQELEEYNLRDAEICWKVFLECYPKLKQDSQAFDYYELVDKPFIDCIIELNDTGMYIDPQRLKEWTVELKEELQALYDEIYVKIDGKLCPGTATWHKTMHERDDGFYENPGNPDPDRGYKFRKWADFNPSNPSHIKYIYKELYGVYLDSTDKDNLPIQGADYELTHLIMEYKEIDKLLNTYCRPFYEKLDENNYVHADWKQTLLTGRISCQRPPLQTLPSRTERGATFRKFITVPNTEEYCIVGIDLDQIEVRIQVSQMAIYCMERLGYIPPDVLSMIDVFDDDEADFHSTMAELWGVERKMSKTLTFARAYGAGDASLAFKLKTTRAEVKAKRKQADDANPTYNQVRQWVLNEFYDTGGLGYTLYGRRLVYPTFSLQPSAVDNQVLPTGEEVPPERINEFLAWGERQAFNARIQGTQADIVKAVANKVLPLAWNLEARFMACVHDELLYMCPSRNADMLVEILESAVNGYHLLPFVKVSGKAKIGDSWYDAH